MRHSFCIIALLLLSIASSARRNDPPATGAAATQSTTTSPVQPPSDPSNFTSAKGFVLEESTPVKLRFNRTVSSADAHVGDVVDFEVLDDVSVNGKLVIPKNGFAFGTVTEAQPKRRMARGGKLEINIDYVKLVSGDKAGLRAVNGGKGGGHVGAMTAGIVATGIVFFPAAPFFLFMHGKDITLPKGAEFTAYINGDIKLDLAKFQPASPAPASNLTAAAHDDSPGSLNARLQIQSNPAGADIEVDGNFMASTPSDVQVAEGEHTIVIKKSGFKSWERKLKTSAGGNVHLEADLEKAANSSE